MLTDSYGVPLSSGTTNRPAAAKRSLKAKLAKVKSLLADKFGGTGTFNYQFSDVGVPVDSNGRQLFSFQAVKELTTPQLPTLNLELTTPKLPTLNLELSSPNLPTQTLPPFGPAANSRPLPQEPPNNSYQLPLSPPTTSYQPPQEPPATSYLSPQAPPNTYLSPQAPPKTSHPYYKPKNSDPSQPPAPPVGPPAPPPALPSPPPAPVTSYLPVTTTITARPITTTTLLPTATIRPTITRLGLLNLNINTEMNIIHTYEMSPPRSRIWLEEVSLFW